MPKLKSRGIGILNIFAKSTFFPAGYFLAALLAPVLAHAQGAAPSMYGVQEVVVESPRFDDPKASSSCSLTKAGLTSLLDHVLDEGHVPMVDGGHALPPRMDVARIQLIASIATMNNDGLDCTSWVALTAQSQNNLVIAPVNPPRNLTVMYWHAGKIVASPQSSHGMVVSDALEKMVTSFVQQYEIDQPKR